jgi:ATP-binding cassette subfamily F protein 3
MLTIDNLYKSFGSRTIFDGASWSMSDDARVGLVGLNGAGKTTLFKMIAGIIAPDAGRITRPQRTRVGYLAQDAPEMGGRSVLDETLSALDAMQELDRRRLELESLLAAHHSGPVHDSALAELGDVLTELERHDFYSAESRATAILFALGFKHEDLGRDVAEFSGGIRMRVALAKLLLSAPEFLMLDEPTNHLDIEARNWLEEFLADYRGGIILVSHDRYFLDRVTNLTVEVARGRLIEYQGNYSAYLAERERRAAAELVAYEKQRQEIEHIEAFISRFRYQASKAALVQSRIKQLEKIVRLEPPAGLERPPAINFPECERGARQVFELRGAAKRYGDLVVYDGIDLTIERGARLALVGPNGAGKSTLMKLLAGVEELTAGSRHVGDRVRMGYFAQNLADGLDYNKTVLEELDSAAEGMTTTEVRNLLGAMLFSGDDAYKRVGVLSGGERARLALAKVLARRNNCLLLDEPTNNLDIVAKETLLAALRRFPGTVVIVSHDRYILNELVTEVVEVGRGHAVRYLGNYDQYLEKKAMQETSAARKTAPSQPPGIGTNGNGHAGKTMGNGRSNQDRRQLNQQRKLEREAMRDRSRLAQTRERMESEIARKEAERAELAAEMNDPDFYLVRTDANEMIGRYEALGREIEKLYNDLLSLENDSPAAH